MAGSGVGNAQFFGRHGTSPSRSLIPATVQSPATSRCLRTPISNAALCASARVAPSAATTSARTRSAPSNRPGTLMSNGTSPLAGSCAAATVSSGRRRAPDGTVFADSATASAVPTNCTFSCAPAGAGPSRMTLPWATSPAARYARSRVMSRTMTAITDGGAKVKPQASAAQTPANRWEKAEEAMRRIMVSGLLALRSVRGKCT